MTAPTIEIETLDEPAAAPRRQWRDEAETEPPFDVADEEERSGLSVVPVALVAIVAVAFLLRLSMAEHLSSHIDESASIMAAREVAERGVPLFPSGNLYLQGATISYLLAPFVLAGRGEVDDLTLLRFPSVAAGTAAVLAMFVLVRFVAGSSMLGLVGALLLALDPISIRWGGYVRMYALLQLLSIVLVWLFIRLLLRKQSRRLAVAFVALFWVAVFTHIAVMLFFPAMALVALVVHGEALLRERHDLLAALGASAGAPVALVALNRAVSPSEAATGEVASGGTFVGDYLLSIDQLFHPDPHSWELLFGRSGVGAALPAVMVGASFLLIGWFFLGARGRDERRRRVAGALLALYWLPIGLVAAFATEANERYLLHVHPLGLALLVLLGGAVWRAVAGRSMATARGGREVGAGRGEISRFARSDHMGGNDQDGWRGRVAPMSAALTAGNGQVGAAWMGAEELGGGELAPVVWRARAFGERAARTTVAHWAATLGAIVVVAAGLRLVRLTQLSLWLDEGFTVLYARQSWPAVLGLHGFYSPHPPLYFSLVKAVSLVVPDAVAGRLVSVVAAAATIPVCYALAARTVGREAGLIAAGTLALAPLHLYYAQEARMYALVVLLIALSYLALVAFWQEPSRGWALGYAVSTALALYVDYSAIYALAPQALLHLAVIKRWRRGAWPLAAAAAAAIVAYLPWLPRALSTVGAANEIERRQVYLGVDAERVATSLVSVAGFGGDGWYFFATAPATPWTRWPESRLLLIPAAIVLVVIGLRALWGRWEALAVVLGLGFGTIGMATWISLISPGYAERTILAAALGWAVLAGAALSGSRGWERALAVACLALLLLGGVASIAGFYERGVKQRWSDAADDVAAVADLGIPVATYSYGTVANELVDVYHPGIRDRVRLITIRDGRLEDVLSDGTLPEIGLTRGDLAAGRLAEALPAGDPGSDAVWLLSYFREGDDEVRDAFARLGYQRLIRTHYEAPRYQVFLDLYVQPGVTLGDPFALGDDAGWALPADATLRPDDERWLVVADPDLLGRMATREISVDGAGVYSLAVETRSTPPSTTPVIALTCLGADGEVLREAPAEVSSRGAAVGVWRGRQVGVLCPTGTATLRIGLGNEGAGEVAFRGPAVSRLGLDD